VLCQTCGTVNRPDREVCFQCGNRLMVVSGVTDREVEPADELFVQAQEELEENILERLTGLEDGMRRLSEAVAATAQHLAQLERNLTVAHAGVQSLGGLLETQGFVTRAEVVDGWERTADQELLSRDLSRRFRSYNVRIVSQANHSGVASEEFKNKLRALELALLGADTGTVRDLLTELARMAPDNDELWSFIGEAAFESGELDTARIAFRRVLELRGPQFEALVHLGAVASDLGLWSEAEDALRQARDMAPDTFLPHFTLGALKVLRGQHSEAVTHLERSLAIDETAQSWYLLGICRLALGRGGRAIDALERAVGLAPDFEDALYHLGVAYLQRGWTKKSLSAFQRTLRLDPQRLQYQETVRLLSGSLPDTLSPRASLLVGRAEAALDGGDPGAALDLFGEALDLEPSAPLLLATAALLASATGRTRDAVGYAHTLLRDRRSENSPSTAAAVVALLESLRQNGKPLTARRFARRIYEDESIGELVHGLAAYELALIETEIGGELETARNLAREALEIAPKELRHYPLAALGSITLKLGRYREAMQYLEQAAQSGYEEPRLRQLAAAIRDPGHAPQADATRRGGREAADPGIDHELLGHVRRLGGLSAHLTRNHRAARTAARRQTE
jgi:tetratricopeptide (TPR) repeat protein